MVLILAAFLSSAPHYYAEGLGEVEESEVRFRSHIRQAGRLLISATKDSIFVRTWSPPAPPSANGNKVKESTLVRSSKPALAPQPAECKRGGERAKCTAGRDSGNVLSPFIITENEQSAMLGDCNFRADG